ncbi:MAG: methionyl-tRNA formyltransferase [Acidisphaera sp.]|nr:methionyl-tRNA formyltransferase [Acidisphaera sp.]
MRIVFMGSPSFAVPALLALHGAGHTIAAVYCQKPRPSGRGQAVRPCAVHVAAERLGFRVRTPGRLRSDTAAQQAFAKLEPDAAVVVAYGLILPPAMLAAPRRGCLNIHASLLPRWRGAAPIQAAILAGDRETGITIMRMDEGLDTGPILLREAVPITGETTASGLHEVLSELGARLVLQALEEDPPERPQSSGLGQGGESYAPKLSREDGWLDWSGDSLALDRRVRALTPWPGTFTTLAGETLKVLAARPVAAVARAGEAPGTVLDEQLTIACGEGALQLTRVQLPGRGALDASLFLRGRPVPRGTKLG